MFYVSPTQVVVKSLVMGLISIYVVVYDNYMQ